MKSNWVLMVVLLLISGIASAQSTPTNPGGFLNTDPRSPYYNSGNNLPPAPPQERWADRWGAFASASSGVFGGAQDKQSKRQAEKTALAECKEKGGDDCRVDLSYYNQCGAVASGGGHMGSSRAPTEREAVEHAIKTCEKAGGSNCQLYFMGCSLPVRVN